MFIATDMCTFSVIEKNRGFEHLVKVLRARYKLRPLLLISAQVVPTLYKQAEVVSELLRLLQMDGPQGLQRAT
jgi:hypothetical protein